MGIYIKRNNERPSRRVALIGVVIMKKYKVYDLYEGKMSLGYADTMSEVRNIVREQAEETDNESRQWNMRPKNKKSKRSNEIVLGDLIHI